MKVFISHADTDKTFVRKVVAGLEEAGFEAWDASREILPGDNWADITARALQESEAMVVLLSPDALRSGWVRREIDYALGEQRYANRLIPVLPKELNEEEIPWILRHLRMVQLGEDAKEEEGIHQIAQALLEAAS